MIPPAMVTCRYCGARSDMDPIVAARLMVACNNCQADLLMGGGWTGKAKSVLEARDGLEARGKAVGSDRGVSRKDDVMSCGCFFHVTGAVSRRVDREPVRDFVEDNDLGYSDEDDDGNETWVGLPTLRQWRKAEKEQEASA